MHQRISLCAVLLGAATAAWGAGVSDTDLARCAQIGKPDARLVCYDALAHRPADPVVPAATAPTAATTRAAASTVAPAPSTASSTTPASTVNIDDPANFGLTLSQMHPKDSGPKSISATISHLVPEQLGHARVVLDNDEIWQVLDDDGQLKEGGTVVIKRASLGSFIMTTQLHHTYRVHRLR